MRQVKVSLDEEDITLLERRAQKAGISFSEEVRRHIRDSLAREDIRPDVIALWEKITSLIWYTETATWHRWDKHAATATVLQSALQQLMARYGARDTAKFEPGELPDNGMVVSSDGDPVAIGITVEALSHRVPMHDPGPEEEGFDGQ